jgi:hypothetical protein
MKNLLLNTNRVGQIHQVGKEIALKDMTGVQVLNE